MAEKASNKKKALQLGAIALGAVSIYGLYSTVPEISRAEEELNMDRSYQTMQVWKEAGKHVNDAKHDLTYRAAYTSIIMAGKVCIPVNNPEVNPDPTVAKYNLSEAAAYINDLDYSTEVIQKIDDVKDILPDGKDIKIHNGKEVNSKTFDSEKAKIADIYKDIDDTVKHHYNQIPDDVRSKKNRMEGLAFFSGLVGIIGIGAYVASRQEK